MPSNSTSLNEFQIALKRFKTKRLAVGCAFVLMVLYAGALFADFLSPYSYKDEDRQYSYCPPTPIHIWHDGKLSRPFVYKMDFAFNDIHQRIYKINPEQRLAVQLFKKGEKYKFLGVIPCVYHLFGVNEPGRIYLFGADSRGRDLFSRILYGGRISLSIGIIGVLISFSIGLIVGGIAGYYGGRIDDVLMRLCEMVQIFPAFYLLLALRAAVPSNLNSVQIYFAIVIILSFIGWASLARIVRGMCLSLRERDYVLAARAMGQNDFKIIVKHILPHTLSYSIAAIMLSIPGYIVSESALSLVGLGIQDPFASWGNLLSDAMTIVRIKFAPWMLVVPAFFIFVTMVCFNVIGDALRDCLDPLLKK